MDHDPNNITGKYVLSGQTPVPEPDPLKWGEWHETADRQVALTQVGPYHISTVFLGIDHRFMHKGPPLLFQTMVFSTDPTGDAEDRRMDLCSTWSEAEEMHARMVKLMQEKCAAVSD